MKWPSYLVTELFDVICLYIGDFLLPSYIGIISFRPWNKDPGTWDFHGVSVIQGFCWRDFCDLEVLATYFPTWWIGDKFRALFEAWNGDFQVVSKSVLNHTQMASVRTNKTAIWWWTPTDEQTPGWWRTWWWWCWWWWWWSWLLAKTMTMTLLVLHWRGWWWWWWWWWVMMGDDGWCLQLLLRNGCLQDDPFLCNRVILHWKQANFLSYPYTNTSIHKAWTTVW